MENAEEEKERQTAALLSWEMVLLYKITLNSSIGNSLPLGQSEFGLWFSHKGRHYFSGIAEAGHISRLIQEFDDLFNEVRLSGQGLVIKRSGINSCSECVIRSRKSSRFARTV